MTNRQVPLRDPLREEILVDRNTYVCPRCGGEDYFLRQKASGLGMEGLGGRHAQKWTMEPACKEDEEWMVPLWQAAGHPEILEKMRPATRDFTLDLANSDAKKISRGVYGCVVIFFLAAAALLLLVSL